MDPVERLKGFGIQSLHFLALEKEKQFWCTAILASTDKKDINLVVLAGNFKISEGISVSETSGRIVHQSLPDDLAKLGMKLAYLTGSGLDMNDIKGVEKSYLFNNPGETFYRLGFGEKFRLPLICIKLEELKSDQTDLHSILDEKTSLFGKYLQKSSFPNLLKLPGQYTAFIPDNSSLQKNFGEEIPKQSIVNAVVLKVIVSGIGMSADPGKEGDSRVNMLGEPVSFKRGIPMVGEKEVKVLSKAKYSNGIGMIVQITDIGKIPSSIDLKTAESTYQKLMEKYGSLISTSDLKEMQTKLMEALENIVENKRKEFLQNLKMLESWTKEIKSNPKDIAEFIAISNAMLPFFKQVRD